MTFDLRRRRLFVAILLVVAGLAILIWAIGTREEWGPELATDPAYSERPSKRLQGAVASRAGVAVRVGGRNKASRPGLTTNPNLMTKPKPRS